MKKTVFTAVLICAGIAGAKGTVDTNLTSFSFSAQPAVSRWYNDYLSRFFTGRVTENATYSMEYKAIADVWLSGAFWDRQPVQLSTRNRLLNTPINSEGFISAQQHPANSLDIGWPFPVWPQVPGGHKGISAGWHFYDEPWPWELVIKNVRNHPKMYPDVMGAAAAKAWTLDQMTDGGLIPARRVWKLDAAGTHPSLTSPAGTTLDAYNCPYIQIRWSSSGAIDGEYTPYMEWLGGGESNWSETRRMYFYPEKTPLSESTGGLFHSSLPLYRHPEWTGRIERIRFTFPTDGTARTFFIHSIFSHWDTRHLVNNAIYIKAANEYFRWTGDYGFLRQIMPRLRTALRYMMDEGHALELDNIRCTWPGHDGRPGYDVDANGKKTFRIGHGKGGNYWDLLPMGWDDMYTTTHYYASLLVMAQLEELAAENPGWDVPAGVAKFDPAFLREHAAKVKENTNKKFWNDKDRRFTGCIDADGVVRDYGFTFVNLEAVYYGIASGGHAREIFKWINGERIVRNDTSRGKDIYIFRLAPRATTKRNVGWYGHSWTGPETLPFGGQVQDGGAVLGFSFYDVMSRIKILGADNAWKRLMEIYNWDDEVQKYGGYRKYYGDGKGGTTLQGGGTAGGIGIDFEFTESSMISAVIPFGFMGLNPDGNVLNIMPNLPKACPEMTVRNLRYHGTPLDVTVSAQRAEIQVKSAPPAELKIRFSGGEIITIRDAGRYLFERELK
ncbi:MAG: glycosyl hydrolase family 65 protein [Kiritimatiellales bacterium]